MNVGQDKSCPCVVDTLREPVRVRIFEFANTKTLFTYAQKEQDGRGDYAVGMHVGFGADSSPFTIDAARNLVGHSLLNLHVNSSGHH